MVSKFINDRGAAKTRRYKFLLMMGFSVILRRIWWSKMSKVFFAWGNNSVCCIWISCSSWLTVRFSAFQCFQIQWSVGLLVLSRAQGAKELELVAVFIWAAEHLRAGSRGEPAVDWNGTGGYSQGSISLSLNHIFSLFWVSIFFFAARHIFHPCKHGVDLLSTKFLQYSIRRDSA